MLEPLYALARDLKVSPKSHVDPRAKKMAPPQLPPPNAIPVLTMACDTPACHFYPLKGFRRPVGPQDVRFEIKYCGVCHSDLHHAANHNTILGNTPYPCVPGHEIVGIVTEVGENVMKPFRVGDRIGVGTLVDSCRKCEKCSNNCENKCSYKVGTYGAVDKTPDKTSPDASYSPMTGTMGGYSTEMVINARYAVKIPEGLSLPEAAPILCAGITMYQPLKEEGIVEHPEVAKVGVAGLGGLGVFGIQLTCYAGTNMLSTGWERNSLQGINYINCACCITRRYSCVRGAWIPSLPCGW